MKKPSKKHILAVLAGVVVAAAVSASAASLGGLTTEWLGANSNVVASPIENGLDVTWSTAYDASAGYYVVDGFTLSTSDAGEALPAGAEVELTLQLSDGSTEVFSGTVAAKGAVDLAPARFPHVAAHDLVGVAVVVVGGGVADADPARP